MRVNVERLVNGKLTRQQLEYVVHETFDSVTGIFLKICKNFWFCSKEIIREIINLHRHWRIILLFRCASMFILKDDLLSAIFLQWFHPLSSWSKAWLRDFVFFCLDSITLWTNRTQHSKVPPLIRNLKCSYLFSGRWGGHLLPVLALCVQTLDLVPQTVDLVLGGYDVIKVMLVTDCSNQS